MENEGLQMHEGFPNLDASQSGDNPAQGKPEGAPRQEALPDASASQIPEGSQTPGGTEPPAPGEQQPAGERQLLPWEQEYLRTRNPDVIPPAHRAALDDMTRGFNMQMQKLAETRKEQERVLAEMRQLQQRSNQPAGPPDPDSPDYSAQIGEYMSNSVKEANNPLVQEIQQLRQQIADLKQQSHISNETTRINKLLSDIRSTPGHTQETEQIMDSIITSNPNLARAATDPSVLRLVQNEALRVQAANKAKQQAETPDAMPLQRGIPQGNVSGVDMTSPGGGAPRERWARSMGGIAAQTAKEMGFEG